jgi:hypothetical protein
MLIINLFINKFIFLINITIYSYYILIMFEFDKWANEHRNINSSAGGSTFIDYASRYSNQFQATYSISYPSQIKKWYIT